MTLVIILGAYAVYMASAFRRAAASKAQGVFWPCMVLFAAGVVVQALHELNIPVPSPAPPIAAFVTHLFGLK
jgi:hypothetical protein